MKNALTLLISAITLSTSGLYSQLHIERDVVAAGGELFSSSSANTKMVFTVGEMTLINTFRAQGNMLTQGFHQPQVLITGIEEPEPGLEFVIYPVPAREDLNVKFPAVNQGEELQLRLLDLHGKEVVSSQTFRLNKGQNISTIRVNNISSGMYMLELIHKPNLTTSNPKFYKVSIQR